MRTSGCARTCGRDGPNGQPGTRRDCEGGSEAIRRWREQHLGARLDLREAVLCEVDLSGADLRHARVDGADLHHANLQGANLGGAKLLGTKLRGAKLADAQMQGAKISRAILAAADLSRANLQGVSMLETYFGGTKMGGADFSGAHCFLTLFADVDLSQARGLDAVHHIGPSIISVGTLFESKGKIPAAFLRGAGVPDGLIQYVRSLTGAALEFYTCFISFTEADDAFSQRLHNDLQAAGVRCWRWKEKAKWGRTLTAEVDAAIREYDKLVVVLSEASLNAQPVIRQVERALQKEHQEALN